MAIAEQLAFDAVGRDTARAWMDTTIQEALQILESERKHVRRTEAGWRFRPPRSEYYAPLHRQMSNIAAINLVQMCERINTLKPSIDAHDEAVRSLVDQCKQLTDSIVGSTEFIETVTSLRKEVESSQASSWDAYFGAYGDPNDRLQLLAGHIVNRTRMTELTAAIEPMAVSDPLPDSYTIAPLWNGNRARFISVLQSPEVKPAVDLLVVKFTALEERIETLTSTFAEIRKGLGIKHDLPYATPPGV